MASRIPLDIYIGLGSENEDRSDYRAVPRSDEGNDGYRDRGMLGSFPSNRGEPFAPPAEVRFAPGFGADMADYKRGWCDPLITEHPAYQLESYKERSSQPRESDVTPGNVEALRDDWEFRNRNRRTRGFLTRPRIPVERG